MLILDVETPPAVKAGGVEYFLDDFAEGTSRDDGYSFS